MLNFNEVSLILNNQTILDNVSLSLNTNQIICVLGPSGAGKTSFLRCASTLEKPTKGTIHFNNNPINLLDKSKIGVVFQGYHLFPHLFVRDNLILAPQLVNKMSKNEAERKAVELLDTFGLSNYMDFLPHRLSGGQKQRVAIARTLMMDPNLLFFDEPTSALDPESVNDVATLITSLKNENRVVVVITHEIRLAQKIADQILFFNEGRLLDSMPKSDFFDTSPANVISARAKEFLNNLLY